MMTSHSEGYTNYWTILHPLPELCWRAWGEDVRKLVEHYPSEIAMIGSGYPPHFRGEPWGDWFRVFNTANWRTNTCRTHRLPYDLAVKAALISLDFWGNLRAPAEEKYVLISSDGKDSDWDEAERFWLSVFPDRISPLEGREHDSRPGHRGGRVRRAVPGKQRQQ